MAKPIPSRKQKLPAEVRAALTEQQARLFRVQSVVVCVQKALEEHFGDWSSDVPPFNEALAAAAGLIGDVNSALYETTLVDSSSKFRQCKRVSMNHEQREKTPPALSEPGPPCALRR